MTKLDLKEYPLSGTNVNQNTSTVQPVPDKYHLDDTNLNSLAAAN